MLRPWLSVLVVLAIWQFADVLGWLNERVLPGPGAIWSAFFDLAVGGQLGQAILASLPRVLIGMTVGILSGTLLGLVSGFWRLGEDLVDKPMQMVRAIPFTALVPLFILWFGIDEAPKIALVIVGTAVPLYINTSSGIKSVDRRLLELAQLYRLSSFQTALQVLIPAALPQILAGLRHGLGLAWVALIVAETIGANAGVGFLLTTARQYGQTDVVIVCILLYAALGVLTDLIVRGLETYLLRWRPNAQRS
ncbi:ABC transporter permease subunit [Gulosibacter chungangensis]|uniref:ABC transporter permease subunit n=2 Tax=Gulosibacter chungangensis TaxID=979746 RepID=A0A7J5BDE6_9MICO|nr:ABC transporter permease subunit [Gulosibacter chungangensis]